MHKYKVAVANESMTSLHSVQITTRAFARDIPELERDTPIVISLRGKTPDKFSVTWTTESGTSRSAVLHVPKVVQGLDGYILQFSEDGARVDGLYMIMPKDTGFTSDKPTQQLFDSSDEARRRVIGFRQ